MTNPRNTGKRPSFSEVKRAAQSAIHRVLEHWLPGGKLVDGRKEYTAPNPTRADRNAGSLKVNLSKGTWSDFATGDKGGDLIDLVVYVDGCTDVEACNRLADFLHVMPVATATSVKEAKAALPEWVPVLPVLESGMSKVPPQHPQHGAPSMVSVYKDAQGAPLMVLYRFDLPPEADGKRKKVFAPLTWCQRKGQGTPSWRWQGLPEPRPLLNLDQIALRKTAPVLVCEGEKSAQAGGVLLPDHVATCWPNGTNAWQKADFSALAGRDVVLWPDHDEPGRVCMDALAEHLRKVGAASVRLIDPMAFGDMEDGDDAANLIERDWTVEQMRELERSGALLQAIAAPAAPAKRSRAKPAPVPNGFRVTDAGVVYAAEGDEARPVCSRLEILARTRDDKGHNWGLLVEFDDPDGERKRWNIPARCMAGDFGKEVLGPLVDMGLRLAGTRQARHTRNDLQSYLQGFDGAERARLVTRMGWHGGAYLLPSQQVGNTDEHLHYYDAGAQLPPIEEKGTLQQWQSQVAALCVGNHRLAFAVSVALAGPLLHMLGAESGGFHLYGDSSGGKTTHLQVAASVYGSPKLLCSWRSTDNALESIAASRSDGLLVLDEIGLCEPRIIGETVYMLGNGAGKARANDRGQAGRAVQEWRLLFLSTGEKTLAQHMAEAHKELKAGMEVRLLAVPADAGKGAGMFESLHGFIDAAALSNALKARSAKLYGTALVAFLEALCEPGKGLGLLAIIRQTMERFVTESLPANPSGQAQRAASRFALAAAAGELATAMGVTGWPEGTATTAAQVCLNAWLSERGGAGNLEGDAIVSRLRMIVERFGESRFTRWEHEGAKVDDHAPRTTDRLGFRRTMQHGAGSDLYTTVTYYFLPTAWREEVFKGMNVTAVNKELIQRGILQPGKDGKAAQGLRIPGMPKSRVYVVNAAELDGSYIEQEAA